MAGSLTILYRRKRNVGGRVLRNFARSSSRYFGGHVSREDVTCVLSHLGFAEQLAVLSGIGCKVYICSRRFKRIGVLALIRSVTNIANIKFST